jgi:drug/metabolite transporter (DMT)-like permease
LELATVQAMPTPTKLTPGTALCLLIPPLLWAGNAVVGRLAAHWISPITFNWLRWTIALALMLPLAGWVLRPDSPMWRHWKRFALMGLLAIGGYNTLQYQALQTSTPMNVTLVASSMPVWMLLVGRLWFGAPITPKSVVAAGFSLAGVLVVLTQGQLETLLELNLVPGDAWMLLAAFVWAGYSWLLTRPGMDPTLRSDWAAFLLAQMVMGWSISTAFTGVEWVWMLSHPPTAGIQWGWPLAAVLVYVSVGPSILAYRFWGAGVQKAGPTVASFFNNLTPLFAAVMSATFLGTPPKAYHGLAFGLIVVSILVSAQRR